MSVKVLDRPLVLVNGMDIVVRYNGIMRKGSFVVYGTTDIAHVLVRNDVGDILCAVTVDNIYVPLRDVANMFQLSNDN